ncbi:MAG: hypothetical protein LBV06_02590 [Propionibacteriaceae bacterium]|jgi:hypothetical protein|nr:hypothetical protein [Propionibacteriaceae bacterium]
MIQQKTALAAPEVKRRRGSRLVTATAALTGFALLTSTGLLGGVAYAQETSPANISTVTNTSTEASRAFNWDAATIQTNMNLKGSPNAPTWASTNDPTGQKYLELTQDGGQAQFRYGFLTKQVSANTDFTVNGYFNPNRLVDNNQSNHGDWVGLVLIPQKWEDITINPTVGGGLGIDKVPNAIAAGVDMNLNSEYNDGMWGPYVGVRYTNSSGGINNNVGCDNIGMCTRQATAGQDIRQWGTTMKYTLQYFYNGGNPYVIYTLTDGTRSFTVNTQNSGVKLNVPVDGVFTIGVNAVNGQNTQGMRASIDSVQGTTGSYKAAVNYLVDPQVVPAGGTVAPSTTLSAGPGEIVGVAGVSTGAIAGTDTYAYDGSVPATADAKYKAGWHPTRTTDKSGTKSDLTFDMVAANNVLNIYYAPDYQEARLVTDATDPQGAKTVATVSGLTGNTITGLNATDADLARTGYTATITAPNGTAYATLAAAQASAVYDATPNGTAKTDSAPQFFTVSYKIRQDIIDAANKAITDAKASTVATEPAVQDAQKKLQDLLNNPAATPQQIQDATKALNDAVTKATNDRQAAKDAGNSALVSAGESAGKNDPAVVAAEKALQDTLNNPNSTTQQIKDATTGLNNAVDNATSGLADARDKAAAAVAATKPVSNEPAVKTAASDLQKVLDDPNSSTQQILDATHALQSATDAAKTARDKANTDANAAIDSAKNGPSATNPDVAAAITKLQQIQAAAAADSPTDLTQNIIDATKALNDLVAKQDADRKTASDAAQTAIAATAPVSNEPATSAALTKLRDTVNNPNSTAQQITDATSALNGAVNSDKADRNSAVTAANTAIAQAKSDPLDSQDPAVQAQLVKLQDIMDRAAADSSTDLTKDIVNATSLLHTYMQAVDDSKTAAINHAQTLLADTKPVSNEPEVAQAMANVNTLLKDPATTTQQMTAATTALENALNTAKPARTAADTAATDSIKAAQASPVDDEKAVRDAITALQSAQTTAASDSPDALTKDLTALTQALKDAVSNATVSRTDRDTAADQAMADTKPVSYEPAVADLKTQLQTIRNNPDSTNEQIQAATQSLTAATTEAKTARTAKIDEANQMIADVNATDVAVEPTVKDAIAKLNAVIEASKTDVSTALTKDIQAAIDDLVGAYADAENARVTALQNADKAIQTSKDPVIATDPAVVAARDALQKLLDDPMSTTAQITEATNALNDAIKKAADDAAGKAIDNAKASPVANETPVKDAQKALEDLRADPASTPQQIMDATTALNKAVDDAKAARDAANDKAQKAIDDSTPVASVPAVADAKKTLDDLMKDPTATTKQINDAADALNTAARNAAITEGINAIDTAKSSPVADDPGVTDAIKKLQDLLNDPNSTTKQITDATKGVKDAMTAASGDRSTALDAAQKAMQATQPVSYEPAVADARKKLQAELDDPTSTKEELTAATSALTAATDPAKADRTKAIDDANALVTAVNGSPQASDPGVQAAIVRLNEVIEKSKTDSPDALTADIRAAMTAVTSAQKNAQDARDAAVEDAKKAITASNQPPVSTDPAVVAARDDLQKILDDPNSTAEQIKDATKRLNDAIDAAGSSEQAARNATQRALDATKPVSYEPDVKAARDAAQKVLDDPNSTPAQFTAATTALTAATDPAKTARTSAIDEANTLITSANGSPVANEAPVKDAIAKLNAVIEQSKTDTADALTKDIKAAIDALKTAQKTAQDARDAATAQSNTDITTSKDPAITDNPTVRAARDALQTVLDDPTSTTQQIKDADDKLQNAIDNSAVADKGAREAARTALENASPVSNEPDVKAARDAVQTVLNNPGATTDQVTAATAALNNVAGPTKTDRIKANDDAHNLINTVTGSPVANDPAVQDAITKLNGVVDLAKTDTPEALTEDIRKAMDDLTTAQKTAQTARDKAIDDAKTAITKSNDPSVANDPDVIAARDNLQKVLNDPKSTTAQIIDATTALTRAVGGAVTADEAARDAAKKAIEASKPVSYEPGVKTARDAAQKILDDPSATLNQMTDATTALTSATDAAKTDRTSAVDDGGKLITTVMGSPVANETPVKDALNKLNAVIEKSKTDSPEALTADIRKAMNDLTTAQKTAQTARDKATTDADTAITLSNIPTIAKDPAVVAARDDLQKVLKDPTSTTQKIIDATKKLNDASRTAAIGAADKAKTTAESSTVAKEPSVVKAIENLTKVVGDPASTTPQIIDAITGLDKAVTDAKTSRDQAVDNANNQVKEAFPYLVIPAVSVQVTNVQKVIDDSTSSTQAIIDATNALIQAMKDAVTEKASQIIIVVEKSPVANEPVVVNQKTELTVVVNQPNSSVTEIVNAINNLQKAFDDATKARDDAKNNANQTIKDAQPVITDPDVSKATDSLVVCLGDPASTTADIVKGTQTLNTAITAAKAKAGTTSSKPVTTTTTARTTVKTGGQVFPTGSDVNSRLAIALFVGSAGALAVYGGIRLRRDEGGAR